MEGRTEECTLHPGAGESDCDTERCPAGGLHASMGLGLCPVLIGLGLKPPGDSAADIPPAGCEAGLHLILQRCPSELII